jgi:hypothetical protein
MHLFGGLLTLAEELSEELELELEVCAALTMLLGCALPPLQPGKPWLVSAAPMELRCALPPTRSVISLRQAADAAGQLGSRDAPQPPPGGRLGIIRNAILFSLHYTIGLYSIVNNHLFASFDFKPLNC